MEILKIFTLPEEGDTSPKSIRKACRGVVLDENNLMPLLFVDKDNYHKLPGGGIKGGEKRIDTFKREIREETGCEIEQIQAIGIVIERNTTWEQISYCYLGKISKIGNVHFTREEQEKGYQLKWVTIQEAQSIIKNDIPKTVGIEIRLQRDLFILQEIEKFVI